MRFKSVIAAFFFVLLTSLIALVVVIHTRSFGTLITRVITDIAQKKAQTSVAIKNISISIFPPGLELNRVSVSKKISDVENFTAEFGKLGFYIGLIEIEEKKLSFGEIKVSNSLINYTFPEKEEELKEIDEKIIDKIFTTAEDLPIRVDTVILENSNLILNHELLEAKRIKLFKKNKSFIARFHLGNIQPLDNEKIKIDEIWGDIEIDRKKVDILRLKVLHDVHSIVVKGKIENYRLLKNAEANLNGESFIFLKNISDIITLPPELTIHKGYANVDFNLFYKHNDIGANAFLRIDNLDSQFAQAEHIEARVAVKDSKVEVSELIFKNKAEEAKLLKPVLVANLKTKKILENPIELEATQLSLGNVLGALGPSFDILKGKLTGKVTFTYDDGDFFFSPKDGFIIDNFRLVVGKDKPFQILAVKHAKLKGTEFSIINKEFQMRADLETNRTHIEVDGFVNSKQVRFKAKAPKIDLWDLGNIADLDIKGSGILDVDVKGSPDDTSINLKGRIRGFEILGYQLGETEQDITIDLKDSNVVINRMEGVYKGTSLSGNGVVNYKDLDIALGINAPSTNYSDVSEIVRPVFSKLDFLPEDLNFNAKLDVSIFGKTRLNELRIKSAVTLTDVVAYGENINSAAFNIGFDKQEFTLSDLSAQKDKGEIDGNFAFHVPSKMMKLKFNWENLKLSSFNISKMLKLNIDGKVSGSISGKGPTNDYDLNLSSRIFDTNTGTYKFEDSLIDLQIRPSHYKGNFSLVGSYLVSDYDIFINSNRKSEINLDMDIPDLKPLSIALFGQHLEAEDFKGSVKGSAKSTFVGNFKSMNLEAQLNQLIFQHNDFNVNYESVKPEFMINSGKITRWDLRIQQPDLFLVTKGSGNVDHSFFIQNDLHFNSKIVEILVDQVLSSDGFIRNVVKLERQNGNYIFNVSSKASELNLSLASVPFPLNNVKYAVDFSKNHLFIHELSVGVDNGTAAIKGDIFFDDESPDINLRYIFDRAEIPVLGKSSANISGEGTILGNDKPYTVNGDIIINRALIVNELSEFSNKSVSQVRYLPRNQESVFGRFVNLNVAVKADNPVRVTNSLMDVALKGEVRLFGSPTRLRGEGHIFAPMNSSRVFFKNSEYLIQNADINFNPKKDITNPDFDVQTMTLISTYKVYAKAYGDLERFNFDLTSDPSLPRNSILSLIAFGYTDEIQNTLTQGQQQNLTQVGVGSFVFDRFKISDILNKQFGLQINLGTVFEQNPRDSLLSGRSQDGQGLLGRTRSATKIELKKRLDEALTVSVSSTMGGGIGQRQNMTLTYGLTKKVQLQGVYEMRTNEDGQEDVIDNSIGGDLIFRWTYK